MAMVFSRAAGSCQICASHACAQVCVSLCVCTPIGSGYLHRKHILRHLPYFFFFLNELQLKMGNSLFTVYRSCFQISFVIQRYGVTASINLTFQKYGQGRPKAFNVILVWSNSKGKNANQNPVFCLF